MTAVDGAERRRWLRHQAWGFVSRGTTVFRRVGSSKAAHFSAFRSH
jgi:hypothetical protein